MQAPKVLLASVAIGFACSTARADIAIDWVSPVGFGNSWDVTVGLSNPGDPFWGYDLVVAEVTGATFETGGVSVATPATWTGHWESAGAVSATGPVFAGPLELDLVFDDPMPVAFGDAEVVFSFFRPGAESAFFALSMMWDPSANDGDGGFAYPFGADTTGLTRSSLAAAPVPGAVFLGAMGLGLIGLVRRRLS